MITSPGAGVGSGTLVHSSTSGPPGSANVLACTGLPHHGIASDEEQTITGLPALDRVGVEPVGFTVPDDRQHDLPASVEITWRQPELLAGDVALDDLKPASGVKQVFHDLACRARQQGQAHEPPGGVGRGDDVART